ncbi:MAG TPA: hypothetical protein VEI02_11525, partial [Planctomycetota bacterium]|nr:hypothetical protein [Planctomycetota bacterium]
MRCPDPVSGDRASSFVSPRGVAVGFAAVAVVVLVVAAWTDRGGGDAAPTDADSAPPASSAASDADLRVGGRFAPPPPSIVAAPFSDDDDASPRLIDRSAVSPRRPTFVVSVTDDGGAPIAGADVEAFDAHSAAASPTPGSRLPRRAPRAAARTDGEGRCRLPVAAGSVDLRARAGRLAGGVFLHEAPTADAERTILLRVVREVDVVARRVDGTPAADVFVFAEDALPSSGAWGWTDADGRCTFEVDPIDAAYDAAELQLGYAGRPKHEAPAAFQWNADGPTTCELTVDGGVLMHVEVRAAADAVAPHGELTLTWAAAVGAGSATATSGSRRFVGGRTSVAGFVAGSTVRVAVEAAAGASSTTTATVPAGVREFLVVLPPPQAYALCRLRLLDAERRPVALHRMRLQVVAEGRTALEARRGPSALKELRTPTTDADGAVTLTVAHGVTGS